MTSVPSTTTGSGRSPRLQARSSAGNKRHRAVVHPAPEAAIATASHAAARPLPRRAARLQAHSAVRAAIQQATADRGTRNAVPMPAKRMAATTTSGRTGRGSRRHHTPPPHADRAPSTARLSHPPMPLHHPCNACIRSTPGEPPTEVALSRRAKTRSAGQMSYRRGEGDATLRRATAEARLKACGPGRSGAGQPCPRASGRERARAGGR